MENNEYFTPSIEDIRINYEYEFHGMTVGGLYITNEDGTKDEELSRESNIPVWSKEKAGLGFWNRNPGSIPELLENGQIRVPFLTKEQIEAEGWKYIGKAQDIWFEKEGSFEMNSWTAYKTKLQYGLHDKRLRIFVIDTDKTEYDCFRGECKDINTLRTISKLLRV